MRPERSTVLSSLNFEGEMDPEVLAVLQFAFSGEFQNALNHTLKAGLSREKDLGAANVITTVANYIRREIWRLTFSELLDLLMVVPADATVFDNPQMQDRILDMIVEDARQRKLNSSDLFYRHLLSDSKQINTIQWGQRRAQIFLQLRIFANSTTGVILHPQGTQKSFHAAHSSLQVPDLHLHLIPEEALAA